MSGEPALEVPTIDVSSKEFYGEGYDDSDKRIPDMTIINTQLGITFLPFFHSLRLCLDQGLVEGFFERQDKTIFFDFPPRSKHNLSKNFDYFLGRECSNGTFGLWEYQVGTP